MSRVGGIHSNPSGSGFFPTQGIGPGGRPGKRTVLGGLLLSHTVPGTFHPALIQNADQGPVSFPDPGRRGPPR
jgi:hypothetical protein